MYRGEQMEFQILTITKEGLDVLSYVSDSFEAMGNIRSTIINPELFQLIREKVPSVMKRTIPIFLDEPPEYIKAPVDPWKGEYD